MARLAPTVLIASALGALANGMVLLLLPIDGLRLGGVFGGFALPGMISIGSVLTPAVGALLVERLGHKPTMIGGLLLGALGALAIAGFEETVLRMLGAFAYGIGSGLYTLSRVTYLSDAVPMDQRGRIVSAVGGMGRVGLFAGPALAGWIATAVSRESALACSALALILAAGSVQLLPTCPTLPADVPRRHPLAFVGRVLREHATTFRSVGIVMLCLAFVRSGRMLLIPICGTMIGLDEAAVGLAKSASMGIDMLLFYPAGFVMDRMGRKWTAVPCLAVLSLGLVMVGFATSTPAFLAGAIVAGAGNGLGAGINMTLAGDFSPRLGRAEFMGVWSQLIELGSVSSPFATGLIAQALALGPAAALVAGVGLGASVFMALGVREPLARTPRSAA